MPAFWDFLRVHSEHAIYRNGDDRLRHWLPSPNLVDGPAHELPEQNLHLVPLMIR